MSFPLLPYEFRIFAMFKSTCPTPKCRFELWTEAEVAVYGEGYMDSLHCRLLKNSLITCPRCGRRFYRTTPTTYTEVMRMAWVTRGEKGEHND